MPRQVTVGLDGHSLLILLYPSSVLFSPGLVSKVAFLHASAIECEWLDLVY